MNEEYEKYIGRKFICPNCGADTFTTSTMSKGMLLSEMYANYKEGDKVGSCTRRYYEPTDCNFQWLRSPENDKPLWRRYDVRTGKVLEFS